MPSKHALLSASAAHRWMMCTPSAKLESTLPSETSPYAEEGTRAHALCENKLKELLGKPTEPIDFEPDPEMEECTDAYRDFVEEELNAAKAKTPDAVLMIEQQLDLTHFVPEGFGTSDAVIVSDDTLVVIDFKYGKGVPVNAVGNPQLRLYALGAYCALSSLFEFDKVKTIVFQPRIGNVSSEEMEVIDLLEWGTKVVKPLAEKAHKGKGEFVPGDHCRFCRAGGMCRARAEKAFAVVDHPKVAPPLLDDSEIPGILDKLDETEKWIADVRKYAEERAVSGEVKWPGYKLVEARTLRKITDQVKALDALVAAGFDRDEVVNMKLKSISDLEKLCGKSAFSKLLGDLVVKPTGAPTLVKESDKRPEINPAIEAFKEK